jgi:hypothetical protein
VIGLAAFSITLAVGLVAPAIARSATVMVAPQAFEYRAVVSFVASPGEANDVLVTWHYTDRLSQSITISDSGAVSMPATSASRWTRTPCAAHRRSRRLRVSSMWT